MHLACIQRSCRDRDRRSKHPGLCMSTRRTGARSSWGEHRTNSFHHTCSTRRRIRSPWNKYSRVARATSGAAAPHLLWLPFPALGRSASYRTSHPAGWTHRHCPSHPHRHQQTHYTRRLLVLQIESSPCLMGRPEAHENRVGPRLTGEFTALYIELTDFEEELSFRTDSAPDIEKAAAMQRPARWRHGRARCNRLYNPSARSNAALSVLAVIPARPTSISAAHARRIRNYGEAGSFLDFQLALVGQLEPPKKRSAPSAQVSLPASLVEARATVRVLDKAQACA